MKSIVFKIKKKLWEWRWYRKNRNWDDTRQKRKAFRRAEEDWVKKNVQR